ncbi:MAG: hypothetical protein AB3N16_13865 [Flavobacteriaceae bacterium]
MKKIDPISTLLLMMLFILACDAKGQVDQRWLRSWNEAQELKPSHITSLGTIAPENEPGTPLVIKGCVHTPDETPAIGVVVHSYHRDALGYDFGENDAVFTTWRLQGWAKTDKNGHFEFKTIRPAPDYIGREGAHIHFTTLSDRFGKQWAPKVFFSDDTTLTKKQRLASKKAGKFGWISDVKEIKGVQYIEVHIKLKEKSDF